MEEVPSTEDRGGQRHWQGKHWSCGRRPTSWSITLSHPGYLRASRLCRTRAYNRGHTYLLTDGEEQHPNYGEETEVDGQQQPNAGGRDGAQQGTAQAT